jgi:hypothetical protein
MAYQNHSIQMGNILWNHLSFSTIIWSTGHCITQSTEMGKYTVEPPQFHYNWMTSHSHFNILYNKPRINRVPVRVETSACWIFQVFVETCAMNKLMLLRPNFGMPKCSTTMIECGWSKNIYSRGIKSRRGRVTPLLDFKFIQCASTLVSTSEVEIFSGVPRNNTNLFYSLF